MIPDDDILDLVDRLELIQGSDQILGFTILKLTTSQVDILLLEPRDHLIQRDPERSELWSVDLDLNLFFKPTVHPNCGHTFQCFQFGSNLLLSE